MKKFITAIILATIIITISTATAGQKETEYFEWIADKSNKEQVYFIPTNTIICKSKEKCRMILNRILSEGGHYDSLTVKRRGGMCLKGWSLGRIIETVHGSSFVKIQYQVPYADKIVSNGWVYIGQIETMESYKKGLIR